MALSTHIESDPPARPVLRMMVRWLVEMLAVGAIVGVVVGIILYSRSKEYAFRAQQYDLNKLFEYNTATLFYDRNGQEITRLFVEDRIVLSHEQIPDLLRTTIVAAEDKRFYQHHGVDYRGIARAAYENFRTHELRQGGSTITQQLAKHLMGNFSKTFDRKLVEMFLAKRIERQLTKDKILDLYLNRIYFGKGYYGVAAAAKGYFGKDVKALTLDECALLAGIIKAPNAYSPRNNMDRAFQQRNLILTKMFNQQRITLKEMSDARETPIELVPPVSAGIKNYIVAYTVKELTAALGFDNDEDIPQGLKVQTTFDLRLQQAAEVEMQKQLQADEAQIATRHPRAGPLQGAAVAMDMDSGALRVMVGGRDYTQSAFNRASMAQRENGALLQPFLYALGFEKLSLHPASMINASYCEIPDADKPEEVTLGDPDKDITQRFLMVQDALAVGYKTCATRVGLRVGVKYFTDWLASAGVTRPPETESEKFWDVNLPTLLETVSLYQALGNGGLRVQPHCIELVQNIHNQTLYQFTSNKTKRVLDEDVARQMTLTLQMALQDGPASGLLSNSNIPVPISGMPGYSEGYRDAWFAGYTPTTAMGVWLGYDKSIPLGTKELVTPMAPSLWARIMQKLIENEPVGGTFPIPENMSKVEVNRRTGIMQGAGFLSPGGGNTFVYLKQSQIDATKKLSPDAAARIRQPDDWSDWLGTIYGNEKKSDITSAQTPSLLPATAEFRLPALRGDIVTADGRSLATMEEVQTLVLAWPAVEAALDENEAVAWMKKRLLMANQWLGSTLSFSDFELYSRYKYKRFIPLTVAYRLTSSQVDNFHDSPLAQEGFALQGVPRRVYPQGTLFAHGIGFLKRVQGQSWKPCQAQEVIYENYEGESGLEEVFNQDLAGQEGKLTIVTTPEGYPGRVIVENQPTAGLTVRTTIDSRLQRAAESAFVGVRSGAAVVMDVRNGDIVAMVSRPTFDPNKFLPILPPEHWQALVSDAHNPLFNHAYRKSNPPGSAFKIITSLAAMRAGVFDPERIISCNGYIDVGNVHFSFPKEVFPVQYREAFKYSVNTYFIDLGLRTGRDALIATAKEFGVGQRTGIILPDEEPGLMPDPTFVRVTHKRNMGLGDVANVSIGQGDVLVTPLQMALWVAAVANNGTFYKPRLVSALQDPSGKTIKTFPSEIARRIQMPEFFTPVLRGAMIAVIEDGTGTPAQVNGITIAGKTGTAQVGSKTQPRQIAWMEGYLPTGNPRYSFSVMVEGDSDQELHGGRDAGKVVHDMFTSFIDNQQQNGGDARLNQP